jgi:transcriptional regulator with XRE-family HTH domain
MRGNHRIDGDSTAADTFGAALRRHRQRLAWSQEDLADVSGVAARTISDLERGVAQQPRSATVRMLAEALVLSGADLAAFKAAARAGRRAGLAAAGSSSRRSGGGVALYAVVVGIYAVEGSGPGSSIVYMMNPGSVATLS